MGKLTKQYINPLTSVIASGILGLLTALPTSAQTLVLAFENTLAPSSGLDTVARAKMLVKNLKKGDVAQAAFFVREKDIYYRGQEVLDFYQESGQLVVNAGARYHYLKRDTGYAMPIDFLKSDAALSENTQYKKHVYIKHFPNFSDIEKQAKVEDFLAEHLFHPVFVTTPVHDGFLNKVVQARLAANRSLDTRTLERIYVQLVKEQIDQKAAELQFWFGYQPTQVVLLQESDVAAYSILGLVDALTEAGYRIIAPELAFTDPIANPYRLNGFSQGGFLGFITGIEDEPVKQSLVWGPKDEQRVRELITQEHMETIYQLTNE